MASQWTDGLTTYRSKARAVQNQECLNLGDHRFSRSFTDFFEDLCDHKAYNHELIAVMAEDAELTYGLGQS